MLNLAVIFRAIRLWISVLTVSENELFRFRLAGTALPLPALTLSLFIFFSRRLVFVYLYLFTRGVHCSFRFIPPSSLTRPSPPPYPSSPSLQATFFPRAGGTICSALFLKLNWLQAPAVQIAPAVPHLHRLITALRR